MKILVTGAAGFVGRHMTKKLCDRGDDVVCVDNMVSESSLHPNLWMDHLKPTKPVRFLNVDCRAFFNESSEQFDMIIHLAAVVGGRLTIENQPLSVAEDLAIDAMMFNWAVKTNQKKVIFLSSSAAYPIQHQTRQSHRLLSEDLIDLSSDVIGKPDLTYGWAKLTGEYLAKLAFERNGLQSVCFRPFSGYGEDQHLSYPYPSLVRKVMKSQGKKPIEVWGSGDQVRDFIYIDDCIDAILHIAPQVNDGRAVNLGTGNPMTFVDLIKQTHTLLWEYGEPKITCLTDKPEGVFYRAADILLMKSYGYTPTTTLEQGLKKTLIANGLRKEDCGCWL